jgi:anhydro-N-acetylmuramic acid kinase
MDKQNGTRMIKTIAGLMSGSSLDGLDIAVCKFDYQFVNDKLQIHSHEILLTETISIEETLQFSILKDTELDIQSLCNLDVCFSKFIGKTCNDVFKRNNIKPDFIASHGHTILHDPSNGFSHQIGHGAHIAALTHVPVVFDFRMQDVAYGGQGAPMVAIAERYLYPGFGAYINLGGIANVSIHSDKEITAWDVCPCNQLLNALAGLRGLKYDENGQLASKGEKIEPFYHMLNTWDFYQSPPPKSLDNTVLKKRVIRRALQYEGSVENRLYTSCLFIVDKLKTDLLTFGKVDINSKILITGGGSHHLILKELLENELEIVGFKPIFPDVNLINYKEAVMIAFAGLLRWENKPNFIASVTGSRKNAIGGLIALP